MNLLTGLRRMQAAIYLYVLNRYQRTSTEGTFGEAGHLWLQLADWVVQFSQVFEQIHVHPRSLLVLWTTNKLSA